MGSFLTQPDPHTNIIRIMKTIQKKFTGYSKIEKMCHSCYEGKESFPVIKGKEKSICKDCYTQLYGDIFEIEKKQKENRRKIEKEIKFKNLTFVFNILKESVCENCGNKDFRVLEFDHRFRELKDDNVSNLITNGTIKKLKEEISKCDILCANCHKIKTHRENNSWRHQFFIEQTKGIENEN